MNDGSYFFIYLFILFYFFFGGGWWGDRGWVGRGALKLLLYLCTYMYFDGLEIINKKTILNIIQKFIEPSFSH